MLRISSVRAVCLVAAVLAMSACSKKVEAPAEAAVPPAPVIEAAPVPKVATFKNFMIGELNAVALRDGGLEQANDNKVFGLGKTPEDVAAVLAAAQQPTDTLALSIQPLLVKAKDRVLLFDTGAASNFGPSAGQLMFSMTDAGIDPNSVTDVFISHLHGDHVGGLVNAQGALAFPNAAIHISKAEWKFLRDVKQDVANQMGLPGRDALVAAMKPKVVEFAPGADLIPGVVKAVDVKGHTPGHSAYLIGTGPDSVLYIGDSLHSFVISVRKPEWPMAYDADQKTAAESRVALVAKVAGDGQRIYAVHFPFPGVGKIEKQGEGYVWVAE